jgi:hypothetical protein
MPTIPPFGIRVPSPTDRPAGDVQLTNIATDVTAQLVKLTWKPNAYGTAVKTNVASGASTTIALTLGGGSGISLNAGQIQPPAAGYLLLSASLTWSAVPGAGRCWAEWAIPAKTEYVRINWVSVESRVSVNALIPVAATDYVQLNVFHSNAGPLNLDGRWRAVLLTEIGGQP